MKRFMLALIAMLSLGAAAGAFADDHTSCGNSCGSEACSQCGSCGACGEDSD